MKKEKDLLKGLLEGMKSAHSSSVRLYLITRHVKAGIPKSRKMLDKYDFRTSRIDLSTDLQEHFKSVQLHQIEETLRKADLEIAEYSVVDEELPNKIYTYALNNALSFAEVVNEQLPNASKIKAIASLKEVKDDLWAYCIRTTVGGAPVYSFRKISRGKVGTDENDKNIIEKIRCAFNTEDAKLELLKKETMNLDDRIDCIYHGSRFFVLVKGSFESMVGLEEEYRENANAVLGELKKADCIEGIDFVEAELGRNLRMLKQLANIARRENHKNLDNIKIKRMQRIATRFGDQLRIRNDKVLVENSNDLKIFLRALCDYYKKGEITGNYYGSNSGKPLQPVEEL